MKLDEPSTPLSSRIVRTSARKKAAFALAAFLLAFVLFQAASPRTLAPVVEVLQKATDFTKTSKLVNVQSENDWYDPGIVTPYKNSVGSLADVVQDDLQFCRFEKLCIQQSGTGSEWDQLSILLMSDDENDLEQVKDILRYCFPGLQVTDYGLVSATANATWLPGLTYVMRKSEANGHPAGWGRAWSAFVSAVKYGQDFIGVSRYGHVSRVFMLRQSYIPTAWEQHWMSTAFQTMAHYLSKAEKSEFPAFFGLKGESAGLICMESAFAALERDSYYIDQSEALDFRHTALKNVGFQLERPPPCSRQDVRVLLFERDRPLWNQKKVQDALTGAGYKFTIGKISDSTPYFEQIAMFYNADAVISVHGSQLTNQAFMRKGMGVFELSPYHFWHMQVERFGLLLGNHFVSLKKNSLPPRELLEGSRPDLLSAYNKMLAMEDTFTNTEKCMSAFECRSQTRKIGVWANIDELMRELDLFVEQLLPKGYLKQVTKCRSEGNN